MAPNKLINQISTDLLKLGVSQGDILLVHSSLKSLGQPVIAPEIVINGLLRTLGENGTLLMPALSYEFVTKEKAFFNLNDTPANIGALPEYFREREGTFRSVHPTHSVCGTGKYAEEILKNHSKDTTPCGPNSPFRRLKEKGGKILMLGCGLRPNTSMHAIEELVEPEYLFDKQGVDYHISQSGKTYKKHYTTHDFRGWIQRYDRLLQVMDNSGLQKGRILKAESYLMNTKVMWELVLDKLKASPLFFVDRENV